MTKELLHLCMMSSLAANSMCMTRVLRLRGKVSIPRLSIASEGVGFVGTPVIFERKVKPSSRRDRYEGTPIEYV